MCLLATASVRGQQPPQPPQPSMPSKPLPSAPFVIDTAEQGQIRVTPIKGLVRPWTLVFLPNGDMLVTEKPGRLRIVRNGVVDPRPISGVPAVLANGTGGLMSVALHPRFSAHRLLYLTYTEAMDAKRHTPPRSRGRLEGMSLVDVKEILVAETPGAGPSAQAPILYGRDRFLYMAVGGANDQIAQRGNSHPP